MFKPQVVLWDVSLAAELPCSALMIYRKVEQPQPENGTVTRGTSPSGKVMSHLTRQIA